MSLNRDNKIKSAIRIAIRIIRENRLYIAYYNNIIDKNNHWSSILNKYNGNVMSYLSQTMTMNQMEESPIGASFLWGKTKEGFGVWQEMHQKTVSCILRELNLIRWW